ncbi:MAG TPA: MurR/RpiR family transcriptional regulator [Candidatus Lachnoclostridium pullistercoris]|uniref:MurR/RpiR family transcriptional regulator n=1 Tax=Candidatus Lachnoclostridium pullistercoris TaxID=2838632 RepID=A0A9D2PD66_9FIRM|nr:MurR/RpiR family transcriptional regulator [Candidatus Lachnoclostridium pullistercoris]
MISLFERAAGLDLTQTEKEILAYFEKNPSSAAYMNLQDLSRVLYTSSATIVRFCQKLGLSGYNDFKYQLRRELKESGREILPFDDYIRHSIARFQDNIASLDLQTAEKIAALLTSKRPLYIYGGNLSSLPAKYLQMVLNSLDYPSILVEWERLLTALINTVSEDAVLLVLSAHGTERYLPVFRQARKRELTVILITCDPDSPLIPYSTISVCTNDINQEYRCTDVNSRIGFFTVIQILIELAARNRPETPAQ